MAMSIRETFAPGIYVDAVVSYVEGPRKFFVQPLSLATELRSLAKRLQVMYGTNLLGEGDCAMTLDQLAMALRADTARWCAAPFQIETPPNLPPVPTYYYRALVLERSGPSTVKVFYVDYGNTSVVPIASLKMLPASFQEQPCMAMPCRLVEGEKDGTNNIDPGNLRAMVDGFHVVVYVAPDQEAVFNQKLPHVAEPLWVSLYVTDGKEEANVGDMLVGVPPTAH